MTIANAEKTPFPDSKPASVEHLDNDDQALREQGHEVQYDHAGIRGILHSPYVFGAGLLASFEGFSFGYDQGVISLILVMPQFHEHYHQTAPGAFIGCLFLPYLADRISRKWGLKVATFFFCLGATIQTASQDYGTLVAGQFIGGTGVGTLAVGAPLYISEISPPNLRGSLLVLEAISIVIGAIIAYWITYGTRDIAGEWAFRLPFLLQMLPALMVDCGIHFFPFSPRWLAMRHRDEDSLASLSKLRRLTADDERVQQEWKNIRTEVRFQEEIRLREHGNSNNLIAELHQWLDLFRPKYIKRTLVALGIPFFQQFSGINAFVCYAPTFFAALGQNYNMALILSGMVNTPRHGLVRRGVDMYVTSFKISRHESSLPIIDIYVLCYAASYGPLAWTLPAEVFTDSKRAKGVGAAAAMIWIANFIIGMVVPQMVISIGWGTYLFFGVFCFAAGIFSYFFAPETSKKSLEQISMVFGDSLADEEKELRSRIEKDISLDTTQIVRSA